MFWGNFRKDVLIGMLIKFVDGFVLLLYIYNIIYCGVVIKGVFYNDDFDVLEMWMGFGVYWM